MKPNLFVRRCNLLAISVLIICLCGCTFESYSDIKHAATLVDYNDNTSRPKEGFVWGLPYNGRPAGGTEPRPTNESPWKLQADVKDGYRWVSMRSPGRIGDGYVEPLPESEQDDPNVPVAASVDGYDNIVLTNHTDSRVLVNFTLSWSADSATGSYEHQVTLGPRQRFVTSWQRGGLKLGASHWSAMRIIPESIKVTKL